MGTKIKQQLMVIVLQTVCQCECVARKKPSLPGALMRQMQFRNSLMLLGEGNLL